MRKYTMTVLAILGLLTVAASGARAGMGFRVTGGFTHISYSDFNDWADEVNRELAGLTEIDNIKWIPEFGGELYYPLSPMIEIGVGASIMSGNASLAYSDLSGELLIEHGMKAYPFKANVYFRPSVPFVSMKPYAFGGAALYYSSVDFSFRIDTGSDTDGYDSDLSTWGYGLQGGGGIEFSIAPKISLDIGFRLRWADIKGYEGTATSLDGESRDVYLVGDDTGAGFQYGVEDISEKGNYEEGSVNLSGYSIYVGIKAGF